MSNTRPKLGDFKISNSFVTKQLVEKHGGLYGSNRPGKSIYNELPSKQALRNKLGARFTRKSLKSNRHQAEKKNKIHPQENGNVEMIPFQENEINIFEVKDRKTQWEILEILKQLPTPYSVRKELRDKLFSGSVKPRGGCSRWWYNQQLQWNKTKIFCTELGYKFELWRNSFKSIEGNQGSGVLSYFVFMKWLFFLNIFIFALQFIFILLPQVIWPTGSYATSVTGAGNSLSSDIIVNTTRANTCSALYTVNVTTASYKVVQDFLQGTGWMEKTALFYGYYSADALDLGSSNEYIMPLAYILVTIICLLVSLVQMTRHTIQSFRETLLSTSTKHSEYGNTVFAGWDFAMVDEKSAILRSKSIYNDIVSELEEEKYKQRVAMRTGGDKCKLYTIRFLINIFVLACLGGAGYGIYSITDFSASFTQSADVTSKDDLTVLLVQYSPSIVIAVLNGVVPLVFGIVVKGEDYSQPMVVKITLIRVVFLRLASLAVLIASIYVTISCSTKDGCRRGTSPCVDIPCWETYVGQAFYKLVIMEFLVEFAVTFFYELPRKLLTTKCKSNFLQKIGPAEFDVPISVLDLVYLQTLCWLGFFYSPLIPTMVVIAVFVMFYIKQLSALYCTVPAQKPYRASKSNSFFMFVLMIAFFMCCVPVGYSIYKVPPSPSCGPFRIYNDMIDIIFITYAWWPTTLYSIVDTLTSTAVIGALLILLILIIYYCSARSSVYKEMVKVLQEQLVLDGKDKAFLLARVNELTGNKGGKNEQRRERARRSPPPPGPPQLKTVNEVTPNSKKMNVSPSHTSEIKNVPPPADYDQPLNYNRADNISDARISNVGFDFD
ncbi:hypothetical protein ScPMuIL_004159 [Solemya velum]